jgi:hypothetical protein
MSVFGPRNDEQRSAAIKSLKALARELLSADEDDAVVVNELACTELGCPPVETVIALLRAGREPQQIKVHKPAVEVTEDDVRQALLHGHAHGKES